MNLAEIAKARARLGVYHNTFTGQAEEAARWLELSNEDFARAWPRKLERHRGWGDLESPKRYLDKEGDE